MLRTTGARDLMGRAATTRQRQPSRKELLAAQLVRKSGDPGRFVRAVYREHLRAGQRRLQDIPGGPRSALIVSVQTGSHLMGPSG